VFDREELLLCIACRLKLSLNLVARDAIKGAHMLIPGLFGLLGEVGALIKLTQCSMFLLQATQSY